MPIVDDPAHRELESDVIAFWRARNFYCGEVNYYDDEHRDDELDAIGNLRTCNDATAIHIRTLADGYAVSAEPPVRTYAYECKAPPTYGDLAAELLPMVYHLAAWEVGAKCLYAFRSRRTKTDHGLWVAVPFPVPVRELRVPYDNAFDVDWAAIAARFFPGVPIDGRPINRGSGDPFLIIDNMVRDRMPDWRELIDEQLEQDRRRLAAPAGVNL